MAGICCGVVGESEPAAPVDSTTRASLRRRLDLLPSIKIVANSAVAPPLETCRKRQKRGTPSLVSTIPASGNLDLESNVGSDRKVEKAGSAAKNSNLIFSSVTEVESSFCTDVPKIGTTSVCGRRRDMEDAVAIHPSLFQKNSENVHFYGVFDGHGCSHVAEKCRERLHEIVKQEAEAMADEEWKGTMVKSFQKMDREVSQRDCNVVANGASRSLKNSCRCELQSPQCDAVGSTAVVSVVTPEKIVVSNCGDSRAVLCRNGVAIPLSSDHKPDRPDELIRIEQAGGRVIYWDGARVLGVLAMSRAIGDNYLKPYVVPDPEVTVTDRTDDDECLILASDGLWDVVPNETACGVARMCLQGTAAAEGGVSDTAHNACSDAALLLTKLALARQSSDNVSVVVVDLRKIRNNRVS